MKVLLVEGDAGSADAPLVRALSRGISIAVHPSATRGAIEGRADGDAVRGLADGDFPASLSDWVPDPSPRSWTVNGRRIGWRWRRKELENYLLDGEVLARSLGWDSRRQRVYAVYLDRLLDIAAERSAARYALLGLLPRWDRHVLRPPNPALSGEALEAELRRRHRLARTPTHFDEDALIARFQAAKPLFARGGPAHHPWVIAGKDLLQAAAQATGTRQRFPELIGVQSLTARILAALQADPAPWSWLPEWALLREELSGWARG